jgi:hypothetical protein
MSEDCAVTKVSEVVVEVVVSVGVGVVVCAIAGKVSSVIAPRATITFFISVS